MEEPTPTWETLHIMNAISDKPLLVTAHIIEETESHVVLKQSWWIDGGVAVYFDSDAELPPLGSKVMLTSGHAVLTAVPDPTKEEKE